MGVGGLVLRRPRGAGGAGNGHGSLLLLVYGTKAASVYPYYSSSFQGIEI